MDIDILFGYNFTKPQKKQLNINTSTDLNGWYNYNSNKVAVNILSEDFKKRKSFNSFNNFFTKIASHETIHHTIWDITGNDMANKIEERFVELMTGEKIWRGV